MNLNDLYKKLGLTGDCLFRKGKGNWSDVEVSLPSRIRRLLEKNELLKTLDAFFYFDNKPLILFFENPKDKKALHKAIWNFNESPIVIIVENGAVEIFNGFDIDENSKLLKSLGGEGKLDDFKYFELVTGKTWEKYNKELSHNGRVDYRLLCNIEEAQKQLKAQGVSQETANALIGKVIFFRYLIDRNVKLNYKEKDKWNNGDLCECLGDKNEFWNFVKHIEDKETGFNGELFNIDKNEFDKVPESALNIIISLLRSENIADRQQSLFDMYDFSILPIEFISNMYEKFIGKENQEKQGAYYTPTFLADYIIERTVGEHLDENKGDYNCRVLDPACGSGIFLVESLRRIIEKYIEISGQNTDTEEFRETLKNIVRANIFGIDKDHSAIQVAIFSIYLTLLDYQTSADIENFKFPNLWGTNLICADAFNTADENLKKLEDRGLKFDCIVGNPPWRRGDIKKDSPCWKYLEQRGLSKTVGNKEVAEAFVFRTLDFANQNTQCALVLASKVFYNLKCQNFRLCILGKLFINQVFELAPVRREVFVNSNKSAIAPACVLFYKNANGESTDENIVEHFAIKPSRMFSLFKVFSLTNRDIQYIQQDRLKEYDWLWKVLVYGSYLDFNFIKRLRHKENRTIETAIKDECIIKQGFKNKDESKRPVSANSLSGWKVIENKTVRQYFAPEPTKEWDGDKLGYIFRDKNGEIDTRIYKAPVLLLKDGTKDSQNIAAISYYDCVYNDSFTGIVSNDGNVAILRNVMGMLNSSLNEYLNLLTASSIGIERDHTHDKEKLMAPYCDELYSGVEEIEEYAKQMGSAIMRGNDYEFMRLKRSIDERIYEKFECSELERDLIDYATTITIPLITKHRVGKINYGADNNPDSILKDYANVFIKRFSGSFNQDGRRFVVKISFNDNVIGMCFEIVDETEFQSGIEYKRNDKIFSSIMKMSSERITERLFVQKDIRGFEKDYFYIFKPNEKRLWHKAVAYLDANEFADAMLRGGGIGNE